MKKFQYQVLRYMPDRMSGEFINLGVVVLSPEMQAFDGRFYHKSGRLHQFFPKVNSGFVKQMVSRVEDGLHQLMEQSAAPLFKDMVMSLDIITMQILPKDDSSLYFTEVQTVFDLDMNSLLIELFDRLITRHTLEEESVSMQDSEVWTKIYKPFFSNSALTSMLHETVVKTKHDELHFERTFQNGALHCFEPVSFQLSNSEVIKGKAYKWAGRLQELETVEDPLHVYLLAALPDDSALQSLVRDKFDGVKIGEATIELVDEKHASALIQKMEGLIVAH
jgi:hypothetical protein